MRLGAAAKAWPAFMCVCVAGMMNSLRQHAASEGASEEVLSYVCAPTADARAPWPCRPHAWRLGASYICARVVGRRPSRSRNMGACAIYLTIFFVFKLSSTFAARTHATHVALHSRCNQTLESHLSPLSTIRDVFHLSFRCPPYLKSVSVASPLSIACLPCGNICEMLACRRSISSCCRPSR